jgi:hypothetical protein
VREREDIPQRLFRAQRIEVRPKWIESRLESVAAFRAPAKLIGQTPSTNITDCSANPSSVYRANWTTSEADDS